MAPKRQHFPADRQVWDEEAKTGWLHSGLPEF